MAHRIRLLLSEVEGHTMTAPRSLLFYRKLLVSHRSSEICAYPSAKAGTQAGWRAVPCAPLSRDGPGTQEFPPVPASFRLKLRPFTSVSLRVVLPPAGGWTFGCGGNVMVAIAPISATMPYGPALNLLYAKSLLMESAGSRVSVSVFQVSSGSFSRPGSPPFLMWAGAPARPPSRYILNFTPPSRPRPP